MARTIPEPTNLDYSIALKGLITQAKAHGVNPYQPNIHAFILHEAEVKSQMAAEIRWRCNMSHPEGRQAALSIVHLQRGDRHACNVFAPNAQMAHDPRDVTCKICRNTKFYRTRLGEPR